MRSKLLSFAKHKDFLIPYNEKTYALLRSIGITNTRVKFDTFETVKTLKLDALGYTVRTIPLSDLWEEFVDSVERRWTRLPAAKMQSSANNLRLDTTHPVVYDKVKSKLPDIEAEFDEFFTRWGTNYTFNVSETPSKRIRVSIDYAHGTRPPVIPLSHHDAAEDVPMILEFGFSRLHITNDRNMRDQPDGWKRIEFQEKAGDVWKTIRSLRVRDGDIHMKNDILGFLLNQQTQFM